MDKKLITIDLENLAIAKNEAGNFVMTFNAESAIKKLLDAQKIINEWIDFVKEELSKQMDKEGLLKVAGQDVSVIRRYYGARYILSSEADSAEEFLTKKVTIVPNIEAIDQYAKEHNNNLPEGISLKDRNLQASITYKAGDKDEQK